MAAAKGNTMRIVLNMALDGTFYVVSDEPCEVYVVNDHCPGDRVYRLSDCHSVGSAAVDAELQGDVIIAASTSMGHSADDRHAAIKNRILSSQAGEPHLKEVPPNG